MILNIPLSLDIDFARLTTHAQCDAAKSEVAFELKTYSVRDQNLELAGNRADRSQGAAAAALAKKDGEIVSVQNQLTATGLTADQQQDLRDELELLQAQRKQLVKRNRQNAGTEVFLAAVDAVQVDAQVAVLTAVLAAIDTHRATLTA